MLSVSFISLFQTQKYFCLHINHEDIHYIREEVNIRAIIRKKKSVIFSFPKFVSFNLILKRLETFSTL